MPSAETKPLGFEDSAQPTDWRLKKIGQWEITAMPLNTFTMGLRFEDLAEFCGPNDLADCILSIRESGNKAFLAPISDKGVRLLVTLAFYASLAPEEGRYPRFRMMSAQLGTNDVRSAASFDNLLLSDVESLRRLAPAAAETDSALLIKESDDKLYCIGSAIVSEMGFDTMIGRPEIVGVGHSPSLIVRVDGPGRLRVSEQWYTLLLEAGRIRQVVDYRLVPQVQQWWNALAEKMIATTAQNHGKDACKYFPGGLSNLIHKAWSSVLASAVERRHGGAFVILPANGDPRQFGIDCRFNANMLFGDEICAFWQACVNHASCEPEMRDRAVRAWTWRRAAVFAKSRVLAGLSSVDGCVVLDRELRVLGFGGKIQIGDDKLENEQRALRNFKTRELMPEDVLKQLGTRHQSAYRLAKAYAEVIVFVVSQDGDLRIFCSDDDNVFGFDRLHAWVHSHEAQ